jgi:hypothetical protein
MTMRSSLVLIALLLAFALGMIATAGGGLTQAERPATTPVMHGPMRGGSPVYPEQDLPLRFNHGQHLALKIDCKRCHTKIDSSTQVADFNFPTGATCDGCHGAQHPRPASEPARCDMCHTRTTQGPDPAGTVMRVAATIRAPKANLSFNHKSHLARGASCQTCHGDMSKVRLATVLQLPAENTCLTCHNGIKATDRCGACHPTDGSGKVVTRSFSDRVAPQLVPRGQSSWGATHDLAFVEDHRGIAKSSPQLCQQCHDETFCTDCHAGAVKPMRIHSGDYLTHPRARRPRADPGLSVLPPPPERLPGVPPAPRPRQHGARREVRRRLAAAVPPARLGRAADAPQSHAFAAQRNIADVRELPHRGQCLACHATSSGASPAASTSARTAPASRARCAARRSRPQSPRVLEMS